MDCTVDPALVRRNAPPGSEGRRDTSGAGSPEHSSDSKSSNFEPAAGDVYEARAILKTLNLPTEIVLTILEFASYYARVSSYRDENIRFSASTHQRRIIAGLYLSSPPIAQPKLEKNEEYKPRFVKFKTNSSDQGWGGEANCKGTYRGSFSWFEATILRPVQADHFVEPLETTFSRQPQQSLMEPASAREHLQAHGWDFVAADDGSLAWPVQRNVTATPTPKEHEVEWWLNEEVEASDEDGSGDGKGFVEKLQPGDVVALWARAMVRSLILTIDPRPANMVSQFPGWSNNVISAYIEVGYDVS